MWPLIALSAAVAAMPSLPAGGAKFQPTSTVSARASVGVRIVHAARFGQGHNKPQQGAQRRDSELADASGALQPAQLLEFE